MRFVYGILMALGVIVGGAAASQAQEIAGNGNDSALIGLSAGMFNIGDDHEAGELLLDYRAEDALFGVLRPWGGVMATTDGAAYGFGGLMLDVLWGENIATTLYTAVGAFHDGDGEDLGHWVEFRSGIELSYRFDNRSRVGLNFSHMSNADIGDQNPGAETLALTYVIPVDQIFN
ncbi:MAG: acyloxyacyl hydrolase [Pseudomonadota bacterium]